MNRLQAQGKVISDLKDELKRKDQQLIDCGSPLPFSVGLAIGLAIGVVALLFQVKIHGKYKIKLKKFIQQRPKHRVPPPRPPRPHICNEECRSFSTINLGDEEGRGAEEEEEAVGEEEGGMEGEGGQEEDDDDDKTTIYFSTLNLN